MCDAECQTDKDLTELTVAQRKELLQLRKENLHLKEELEKKTSTDINFFRGILNEGREPTYFEILHWYVHTVTVGCFS